MRIRALWRGSIWLRCLVVGLMALLTVGGVCSWLAVRSISKAPCPPVDIELHNSGHVVITNLKVCLGKRCTAHGRVAVGEAWTAHVVPLSESSVLVTYADQSERRFDLDLYVEPGWSGHMVVMVGSEKPVILADSLAPPASWIRSLCSTSDAQ